MPPIEIPGLKEEIEKGEFSSWSDDDLIQFMYEPGGSLPNLQKLQCFAVLVSLRAGSKMIDSDPVNRK